MIALKKCPFCGSEKVEFVPDEEQLLDTTTTGFIWCHGCDFTSDSFYSEEIASEKGDDPGQEGGVVLLPAVDETMLDGEEIK